VYYANYLKFMERARTEMLRSIGFEQDKLQPEHGVIFAVHSVNAKYHRPAVFNDELIVTSSISNLAKASLTFTQCVQRESDRTALCSAEIKVACLQADTFSPLAMPASIIEQINREFV
jgi:tol-pal system-associated acyl-CoA thioesterase